MYTSNYVAPTLTVDSIVFQLDDKQHLTVLLIERAQGPFKGWRALPGGYNPVGETTRQAMDRILLIKAGIATKDLGMVEQLYTFDTVARDPRGHAVSVAYMGLGRGLEPKTTRTTQKPRFFTIDQLPKLAYDHADIIRYAHERLQSKLSYTNAVFALLPERFTLSQLQATYEAVLGKSLDKRNFRKKIEALDMVQPTDQMYQEGAHRPAQLYQFRHKRLRTLNGSF